MTSITGTQPCAQPGCTGTIVDGYCDVCGFPPAPGAVAATATPAIVGAAALSAPGAGVLSPAAPAVRGDGAATADTVTTPSRVTAASDRLASVPVGSARVVAGTRVTRRVGTASARLRGSRLGAGLTTVPSLPVADPQQAILANPEVPESRRLCA